MSHKAILSRNFINWCTENSYTPIILYIPDEEDPFLKENCYEKNYCEERGAIPFYLYPNLIKDFSIEGNTIKTTVIMRNTGNIYQLSIDVDSIILVATLETKTFLTLESEYLDAYLGIAHLDNTFKGSM